MNQLEQYLLLQPIDLLSPRSLEMLHGHNILCPNHSLGQLVPHRRLLDQCARALVSLSKGD